MDELRISFPSGFGGEYDIVGGVKVKQVHATCNMDGSAIGIDPGVNFGATVIAEHRILIMNGKLPKREHRYEYGLLAEKFATHLPLMFVSVEYGLVEDAAFRKNVGQVGLAEVRYGFYRGLMDWLETVELIPPMSARKMAFGNGRKQAMDEWPLLNHNAADSLAIAMAALLKSKGAR